MKIKHLDADQSFDIKLDTLTKKEFGKYKKYAQWQNQKVTVLGKNYELVNVGKRHVDHLVLKRITSIVGVCLLVPLVFKNFRNHLDTIWDRMFVVYKLTPPIVNKKDEENALITKATMTSQDEVVFTPELSKLQKGNSTDISENEDQVSNSYSSDEKTLSESTVAVEISIVKSDVGTSEVGLNRLVDLLHTAEPKDKEEEIEGQALNVTEQTTIIAILPIVDAPSLHVAAELLLSERVIENKETSGKQKDEKQLADSEPSLQNSLVAEDKDRGEPCPTKEEKPGEGLIKTSITKNIIAFEDQELDEIEYKDWEHVANNVNMLFNVLESEDIVDLRASVFDIQTEGQKKLNTPEEELMLAVEAHLAEQKRLEKLYQAFCLNEKNDPSGSPTSKKKQLNNIAKNFKGDFFPNLLSVVDNRVSNDLHNLYKNYSDKTLLCYKEATKQPLPWLESEGKYDGTKELNLFQAYLKKVFGLVITDIVVAVGGLTIESGLTKGYFDFCLHAAKIEQRRMNIMHYIDGGIFKGNNKFLDSEAVAFHNDQLVKVTATGNVEEDKKAKALGVKQFCHLLKHTYGINLAGIVSKKYKLDEIEELTVGHIRSSLIGIAANVRAHDLEMLYLAIHGSTGKDTASWMLCKKYLEKSNPDMCESILIVKEFSALTNDQIHFLHSAFTTFPVTHKWMSSETKNVYSKDALELFSKNTSSSTVPELCMDISKLELLPMWSKLKGVKLGELSNDHVRRIAVAELLAKKFAYLDWNLDMICPLPDKDNNPVYYKVYDGFRIDGVIPTLLTPVVATKDESINIHLKFRGTASVEQWNRNFGPLGVGKTNYEQQKKKILAMMKTYSKTCDKPQIVLDITGHSLGGCDPKRFIIDLLEKIAASDEGSPWRKFTTVNLVTHNAPSPEKDLNGRLKASIKKIADKKIPIKINLDHIRFFDKGKWGDIVHECGEASIGATKDGVTDNDIILRESEFFNCNLLEICIDGDFGVNGILDRHSTPIFLGERKCELLKLYSVKNAEDDELMGKKLVGNWTNSYWKTAFNTFTFFTQASLSSILYAYQYGFTKNETIGQKV